MSVKPKFFSSAIGSIPYDNTDYAIEISLSKLDATIWPQLSHYGLNEQMEILQ